MNAMDPTAAISLQSRQNVISYVKNAAPKPRQPADGSAPTVGFRTASKPLSLTCRKGIFKNQGLLIFASLVIWNDRGVRYKHFLPRPIRGYSLFVSSVSKAST